MVRKIKILAFSAFLAILILSTLNTTFLMAVVSQQGGSTTIQLKKEDPRQYGVLIPTPNMYITTSLAGSYQANLDIIDWNRTLYGNINTEYIPGKNISDYGPWYSEGYSIKTPTSNGYIDPWDIRWLNLTALNAENNTLTNPFNINTVWNTYTLVEGGSLTIDVNYSIPIEVDITINSAGPKMMKVDFLTNIKDWGYVFGGNNPFTNGLYTMISPSGHVLTPNINIFCEYIENEISSDKEYNIFQFVAHEVGVYKLLVEPVHTLPISISLEFVPTSIAALPVDTMTYTGTGDIDPTYLERISGGFWNQWYSISAIKGEKFRLDYASDYVDNNQFSVYIWYPCTYGYRGQFITSGSPYPTYYDLIAPITGNIYVSIIPWDIYTWCRFGLYLQKIQSQTLAINGTETVHVSRDERKALDFTLEEDSFLRVNWTEYGNGNAGMYGFDGGSLSWTMDSITFLDSKKQYCAQAIDPLDTKTEWGWDFHYYYLPKGSYEILIKNTDITRDSVFMITTLPITFENISIAMSELVYPETIQKVFSKITFEADPFLSGIKQAKWIEINITKPDIYSLNTTIWEADNLGALHSFVNPSYVIVYNDTDSSYTDWTAVALNSSEYFPVVSDDDTDSTVLDECYIAYPQKWHNIEFNFTQVGSVGGSMDIDLYTGSNWDDITLSLESTSDFTSNGTIELDFTDLQGDYDDWTRGAPFDLPNVEENLYYWLRIDCDSDWATPADIPYINHIRLSNTTLIGDFNLIWVRDSPYQYCDFVLNDINDITDLEVISLLDGYDNSSQQVDLWNIIGDETGILKLLIIPEYWSYSGAVTAGFGINSWSGYITQSQYNCTSNPLYAPWNIIDGVVDDLPGYTNYTIYPGYGTDINLNSTVCKIPGFYGSCFHLVKVYCSPLNWTQLVISVSNITGYGIYIIQDLPWVSNSGPNNELQILDLVLPAANKTLEFGILSNNFTLMLVYIPKTFVVPDPDWGMVQIKLGITQYNTTKVLVVPPGVVVPPIIPGFDIFIVLGISFTAVVVIAYTVKKENGLIKRTRGENV